MVDNWLPSFDMDEQRRLDKQVDAQLAAIRADLDARRHFCPEVTEADRAAHGEFLANMSRLPADAWQHLLRVTDRCIGCGICEKVCPSGSIRVADGRAVHTPGRCQTCLACAHACPAKGHRPDRAGEEPPGPLPQRARHPAGDHAGKRRAPRLSPPGKKPHPALLPA